MDKQEPWRRRIGGKYSETGVSHVSCILRSVSATNFRRSSGVVVEEIYMVMNSRWCSIRAKSLTHEVSGSIRGKPVPCLDLSRPLSRKIKGRGRRRGLGRRREGAGQGRSVLRRDFKWIRSTRRKTTPCSLFDHLYGFVIETAKVITPGTGGGDTRKSQPSKIFVEYSK